MIIKLFEDFKNTNVDIIEFHSILREVDMYPDRHEFASLDFIKEKTDKFVGPGFYEKIYKRAEYIYKILSEIKEKEDLLLGFGETRYSSILSQYNKEVSLSSVMAIQGKDNNGYNGFRHFGKSLNLKSIICCIIHEFLWNTLFGAWSQDLRTSSEAFQVNDEKWNVLNMPKNQDLYGGDIGTKLWDYINRFDENKSFAPMFLFKVGNKLDFYKINLLPVKQCEDIFEEYTKILKKVLKLDFEIIKNSGIKYHNFLNEYEVMIKFN